MTEGRSFVAGWLGFESPIAIIRSGLVLLIATFALSGCGNRDAGPSGVAGPTADDVGYALLLINKGQVIAVRASSLTCRQTFGDATVVAFACAYEVSGLDGNPAMQHSSDVFYKDRRYSPTRFAACTPAMLNKSPDCEVGTGAY